MRKKRRRTVFLLVLLLIVLGLMILMRIRVDPRIEELALAKVSDLASNLINESVYVQIMEGNIRYGDLVTLERDNSGNITALTTNMQEMNQFKTQLLKTLDEKLHAVEEDEISLPLGNLTGFQPLSGRGPKLPVRIVSVASSDANFIGSFTDAGINQTIHQIMLSVSLDLIILLPSGTVTEQVNTDVCVAETVLLGPVPDSYTYFNSNGSTSDAKYFASNEG